MYFRLNTESAHEGTMKGLEKQSDLYPGTLDAGNGQTLLLYRYGAENRYEGVAKQIPPRKDFNSNSPSKSI